MSASAQKGWRVLWGVLLLSLAVIFAVHAQNPNLVNLEASVYYSILDDGGNPLQNGSVVYIIGSSVNTIPGPPGIGTNYLANGVSSNETFLGTVLIGDNVTSNGTFWTSLNYDSSLVQYVYIRYFDYASQPVTGYVWWGQSPSFALGNPPTAGVNTVQFDAGGQLSVTSQSNFVVIPEPSTVNLFLLVIGMSGAMWAGMRKQKADEPDEG
jgi:hypothetical protein